LRFLESPQVYFPAWSWWRFDDFLDVGPYLDDHSHGERLPAVMGLEVMAQAAMGLVGMDARRRGSVC
jgi:hypothetical protein